MRDKNKEEWDRVVRYCGMCKNSDTAQDLFKRARKGARLTAKQISSIEWFAGQMVDLVGKENEVVRGEIVSLPVPIPPSMLLYGKCGTVDRKGCWLVESGSSTVLGRFGNELTLYPNAYILTSDLKSLLLNPYE